MPSKGTGRYEQYHANMFRGYLIARGYEPPSTFHSVIGMKRATFKYKLRGDSPFTFTELARIKYKLRMSNEDFCNIFFDVTQKDIKGI